MVRSLRTKLKISQGALAKRMRLSQSYLSDLERGLRNWTEELFAKMAEALTELAASHKEKVNERR